MTCRLVVGMMAVAIGPALWLSASGAESIDLRGAIDLALQHNRELAKARMAVRSVGIGVARAGIEFASEIRPSGSASSDSGAGVAGVGLQWSKKLMLGTRLSADANMTAGETKSETGDRWSYQSSLSLAIEQPLFENFGTLVNREPLARATESLCAQERLLRMQEADVVVSVVETYVDVLRLETQVAADTQFLDRMEKFLRLTRARESQGKTTRVDSLGVEMQCGRARIRLENDRDRCVSRRQDLSELMGCGTNIAAVLEPAPFLDGELPDNEAAVNIALSNRLDYAQALDDERSSGRDVGLAKKRLGPNISLITRYSLTSDYEETLTFGDSGGHRWFVGVASDGDLLKADKKLAFEESLLNREARRNDTEIIRVAIARQVQQDLATCRRAVDEARMSERNLELANTRARLARRLFEAGRGDNFTVSDAEDEAFSAEAERLAAKAGIVTAMYRLRRTLGTLIDPPQDLKPRHDGGLK